MFQGCTCNFALMQHKRDYSQPQTIFLAESSDLMQGCIWYTSTIWKQKPAGQFSITDEKVNWDFSSWSHFYWPQKKENVSTWGEKNKFMCHLVASSSLVIVCAVLCPFVLVIEINVSVSVCYGRAAFNFGKHYASHSKCKWHKWFSAQPYPCPQILVFSAGKEENQLFSSFWFLEVGEMNQMIVFHWAAKWIDGWPLAT